MKTVTSTILRAGLYFGESPRWHEGHLWYSDFYDHTVHMLTPDGADLRVVEVPGQPAGLGWLPDGTLLIVSMLDRKVLKLSGGKLSVYSDLSALTPFHCNDMVVDDVGRAFIGNFGVDMNLWSGGSPPSTTLLTVDLEGRAKVAADDLIFPNGVVITPNGETLIVAETFAQRLTAFDRRGDGSLTNQRVWADLASGGIMPDGICLDAEGAVWVANARAPEAVRVTEGGGVVDRVTFSQMCYACMLGGKSGATLFAMTALSPVAGEASAARNGRIEMALVDVPHAGTP